ncbi:LuxR C-terminal-related transcriptional regulator [Vasconcelosia minhoensis]|uniref:LuxR C-terminal-related transcriptional regulator n=1 Tax=Vasconcelosia minhoensis TaxID=3366354 RepID=UPI001D158C69|nr:LuxR C-terminal-related transcriptional regulator [Romeria gracilis]
MTELSAQTLDASRLLFDLKLGGDLVRRFTGSLDADAIAACFTDGLVEQFSCVFARLWLVEPDRRELRLVASSGLYTRLDGDFGRVPMGAYKVGKIALNCIPFLSNRLAQEDWVKDRAWAIENRIQGFAGLPLMVEQEAIGVLAVFSREAMAAEFLEVLQILSLSVTGAIAAALNHQQATPTEADRRALSEQISAILGQQKLSLLGTERPLTAAATDLFLKLAHRLAQLPCYYCRLVYAADTVMLESLLAVETSPANLGHQLDEFRSAAAALGGQLQTYTGPDSKMIQVGIELPYLPAAQGAAKNSADSPLTERELDVLVLLAAGMRDREIAQRLFISDRTVKFHVKNILSKLMVRTRIQAVFQATVRGWVME